MTLKLGVDVGGTFTDVLLLAQDTGELTIAKVLSTPEDQSAGVISGVQQACRARGVSPGELALILHGSTVVTNMILEEKGAARGFSIRRSQRIAARIPRLKPWANSTSRSIVPYAADHVTERC